jgi:hypothetical protein
MTNLFNKNLAGEATKTMNVTNKLSKVLEELDFLVVTKDNLSTNLRIVDGRIKLADRAGATTLSHELTQFRRELVESINRNEPVGRMLLKQAEEIHPDVAEFVRTLTNTRRGLIGPQEFAQISRIMSRNLSERAPIANNFVSFWKQAGRLFVTETEQVDIPWVTFDGKVMTQRYRPRLQERIEFRDAITGRRIQNIYESAAEDARLLGKSSIGDAGIGLGVNGNHSNDATIVRRFHLWGRRNNVDTATIHDAFFTNISEANRARDALREIYADAVESQTVLNTLKEMRRRGLSRQSYNRLVRLAREQGLIDPDNAITREDVLSPLTEGLDWYGIGP